MPNVGQAQALMNGRSLGDRPETRLLFLGQPPAEKPGSAMTRFLLDALPQALCYYPRHQMSFARKAFKTA